MSLSLKPIDNDLFKPGVRHRFAFAHQDDDLGYSGLLQRVLPDSRVLWITNGDGLAPMAGMTPDDYAAIRIAESEAALRILGYETNQLGCLEHSEIEIYDEFVAAVEHGAPISPDSDLGQQIGTRLQRMEDALFEFFADADVVWSNAWQGGHPEHDLVHYMIARAVRKHRELGRTVRFYELPQYEILFFVPLRFAPWHKGEGHLIELKPQELKRKTAAFEAYKSQKDITEAFKKLLTVYGLLSAMRLRPFTFKQYASKEYFGSVPEGRDYLRSPHGTDLLDYINEKHLGVRVTFSGAVRRFVEFAESHLCSPGTLDTG